MKLALLSLSALASQAFSQALKSDCDDSGNLVLDIPYPDTAPTPKLLRLEAGSCDVDNYGGSFAYDDTKKVAVVTIPKAACEITSSDLPNHSTPYSYRSAGGLYLPTATIVLGDTINNQDIIFRSMKIAAECGQRTSYTVSFNYTDIAATDDEGCQKDADGTCVFPAYEDDVKLTIKEYTDDRFDTEVTDLTRAKIAGENIYLSMRAETIDAGLQFAVTKCEVVSPTGDRFEILNPGASFATPPATATCSLDGVGLSAAYDSTNFNFQHVLFMLNDAGASGVSSFSLECVAEICDVSEAGNKCGIAADVCGGYQ